MPRWPCRRTTPLGELGMTERRGQVLLSRRVGIGMEHELVGAHHAGVVRPGNSLSLGRRHVHPEAVIVECEQRGDHRAGARSRGSGRVDVLFELRGLCVADVAAFRYLYGSQCRPRPPYIVLEDRKLDRSHAGRAKVITAHGKRARVAQLAAGLTVLRSASTYCLRLGGVHPHLPATGSRPAVVEEAIGSASAELGGAQTPHATEHAGDAPARPRQRRFDLREGSRVIGRVGERAQ
jgi:hypothetical protein